MPTGYTAKLMQEGQTLEEFALTCARNFGALVMLRDEPLDAPIPERFEPSDWHATALERAQATLVELRSMSEKQQLAFGANKKAEEIERLSRWQAEAEEGGARLCEMEAQVLRWQPPTDDHQGLKDFMLQQIEVSKTSPEWSAERTRASRRKDPMGFYREALKDAKRDVEYHILEHRHEVERVRERNEWLRLLRESLDRRREVN